MIAKQKGLLDALKDYRDKNLSCYQNLGLPVTIEISYMGSD
mgnify:CR=1 FL=1